MKVRCRTCLGVFSPAQPDGTPYFHVCPPLRAVLITRKGRTRRVLISEIVPTDRVVVVRKEKNVEVNAIDIVDTDRFSDVADIPRKNLRNENTLRYDGATRVLVAEGLGVEVVDATVEG